MTRLAKTIKCVYKLGLFKKFWDFEVCNLKLKPLIFYSYPNEDLSKNIIDSMVQHSKFSLLNEKKSITYLVHVKD